MPDQQTGKPKTSQRQIIECPDFIPGVEFGEPVQVEYERTVVTSDFFGPELPQGSIMIQHNCWFRPVLTPVKAHLALARVAGYRNAVYGIPEKSFPVLFEHPDNPDILVTTTPLSSYVSARFLPKCDWQIVFGRLKAWLDGRDDVDALDWEMTVKPAFGSAEVLPEDAEKTAFALNAEWFNKHIFFEHAGQIGVFEGYISSIEPDGHQSPRPKTRADCSGEATMIPALDWALNKNYAARKMSGRIMEHLFNGPELADRNPASPTYGGLKFYEYIPAFYSDDNCRASMSCILASELTGNTDYAPNILRCLLMILRSTGKLGFRYGRLDNPASFKNGKTWQDYQQEEYIEYRPHYQAYMWAGFLQAYAVTGHQDFYDKAENALRMTMRVFPKLVWTNGITQEYARLLLPLAFLVEISDTDEHRFWLRTVAKSLLENMAECGAIREMMGDPEYGKYPAPRTNEEYGTTEASLIQRNGDPACDLVYTVNYTFAGLHEAFIATGDEYYKSASDKMADFLCRIQVRSKDEPYLNGCWMRGFDYELWDFFGSSADNGWGAWCVESGWTNTWIAATMALRQMNRGFLCRAQSQHYRKIMPDILKEMSVLHKDFAAQESAVNTAPGSE